MALFKTRKKSSIHLNREFNSDGILFTLRRDSEPLNFPISLTIPEIKAVNNLEQLQLIEDFWIDEHLFQEDAGKYLLNYEYLYQMEPHERNLLDLPESISKVNIELDNDSFVGSKSFKFVPKIYSDTHSNLHRIGRRKGAIIELPTEEAMLLPKEDYELLKLIDNAPNSSDQNEIFAYIAQVKKNAESLNISISEHIRREDYEFIDEVEIDVVNDGQRINLKPLFINEKLDEGDLKELSKSKNMYSKIGKKRVFIEPNTIQQADKFQKIESIAGTDIPRFIQNPQAFLPEDIDISLEHFSERVKGLGIRVYKAQPFIHADNAENGWFEFDTGFTIKDEEGNSISQEENTYFSEDDSDDFKQIDDNTFISVPDQASEFQDLSVKLTQEVEANPSNQLIPSNYILEIFENIANVEFNQPLEEMKESLHSEQIFNKKPPSIFTATLKPFQEEGFVWMKSLGFSGSGGLLADDMGLGKTIQVIAYLSYLKDRDQLGPSLLVLPKTLIDNWVNEMGKFAPTLTDNLYVHRGTDRIKNYITLSRFDIVLTTYQTLIRDQLILGRINWKMVICDEAQAIKNPTTSVSVVVKALKNEQRLALTGTPVENNLSELWSIVDFVQPGLLGSLKEFRNRYEKILTDDNSYDEVRRNIERKIHFIYKRRTKSIELKNQLPTKTDHKIPVSMGKEQRDLYVNIIRQVKEKEIEPMNGIMKLKMVSSHPGLVDSSFKFSKKIKVPKLAETMKILQEINKKDEKVLIFTEYREMQSILKKEIVTKFKNNPVIINGGVDKRQQIVDQFNNKIGFDVLILSPRAAGTGLTITSANHVIHYTRWWNPAVENQATDRVYRIGQEKDVHVYYPIISNDKDGITAEQIMDELIEKKKELAENVIVPSKKIEIEKELLARIRSN